MKEKYFENFTDNSSNGNWQQVISANSLNGIGIYHRSTGENEGEYKIVSSDGTTLSGPFRSSGNFNAMLTMAQRTNNLSAIPVRA